jgi:DNA-directed RNA polymerase subunit RPC12/RpoP
MYFIILTYVDFMSDLVIGEITRELVEVEWTCPTCGEKNELITNKDLISDSDFCSECSESLRINIKNNCK